VLEALIKDWQGFWKVLRKEDREAFDRLMDKARGLASAAGYDPRTDPMGLHPESRYRKEVPVS